MCSRITDSYVLGKGGAPATARGGIGCCAAGLSRRGRLRVPGHRGTRPGAVSARAVQFSDA